MILVPDTVPAEPLKLNPYKSLAVVKVAALPAEPVVFWFKVGKSVAIAIVNTPVVVVDFKIPVVKALKACSAERVPLAV